jgi:hypothetical protein
MLKAPAGPHGTAKAAKAVIVKRETADVRLQQLLSFQSSVNCHLLPVILITVCFRSDEEQAVLVSPLWHHRFTLCF